jgi:glycosyltransferase involved in cell wall biosynthesis
MSKALYLLPRYPSWSETFLVQDLELLLGKGLPLLPVALSGFPGEIAGVPVRLLDSAEPVGGGSGRRLAAGLPRRWRARLATWRHRQQVSALMELALAENVSHLHASTGDLPGLLVAEVARRLGLSFSLDLHARDVHADKFGIARIAAAASFVTTCNHCAAERLLADHPALAPRLHLIHHGLRLADWPFADPMEWKSSRPLKLLFAGRLVAKKGADRLPALAAELSRRGMPVHIVVAGDGPLRAELERQVVALGLSASFCFAGTVPREGIRRFMQQVHALVVPAIVDADGDRDGIPNVVVEALALGLPVVATLAGGLAEIIAAERAWPVAAAAPGAFADALQELAANPIAAIGRAIAARHVVERYFDAEACIWKKVDLFEESAGLLRSV